jgi:hypothetical protein
MKQETILKNKSFLDDYKSKNFTTEQLVAKYHLKNRSLLYAKVSHLRKNGLIAPSPMHDILSKAMKEKHAKRNAVRSEAGYKAAITRAENKKTSALVQYRNIFFPGGFTIQVDKESLNRIVLHKNGSVTIVQD